MANEEHLVRLKEGVEAWNQWRAANLPIRPDLAGVDLREANLAGVNLTGADFTGTYPSGTHPSRTHLRWADLSRADLRWSDLRGANLSRADLREADLREADLAGVNLTGANLAMANLAETNLAETNLSKADLGETNFSRARIAWATFGDVNLNMAQGLETVKHYAPSIVSIDTLYRSYGNIPEVFLRGAGVPDDMITYVKSLVGRPFEFYSCFISYSSQDQEFAERLHADLQNKGVRCWFAPHDIQGGRKIHEQIDQAIRLHERLLLILSAHSMQSEWVKTEIAKARQREVRERRQVLFPMRLVSFEAVRDWECFDADTGKDSAREIREYFIPDFGNWKNNDAYQQAFQRLLRDLKANI
jgi:hypothetical protein